MDREEAIKLLKHCAAEHYCSQFTKKLNCDRCNKRIALDMAIEALSAEPTDLISRAGVSAWLSNMGHDKLSSAVMDTRRFPSADRPSGEWIPCSERLPDDSGAYLARPSDDMLEDYSDFDEVMIIPYDADCESFGWWSDRYDPVSLGYVDSDFDEIEVLAWMPLPKPYCPNCGAYMKGGE